MTINTQKLAAFLRDGPYLRSGSETIRIMDAAADHIDVQAAEIARLRQSIQLAYGYLWHVSNEPGTPNRHYPEAMAFEARKVLRDLLTSEHRGEGINAARAALSGEGK